MNSSSIRDRFDKALESLARENRYLTVEVSKLGYPEVSNKVPTAGVGWDLSKKKIIFYFNPKFCDAINDEEFKFAIAHEAWHLISNHVLLIRDEIKKMQDSAKSQQDIFKFQRKINKAADCVVNDSLVNICRMKKMFYDEDSTIKAFYGKEVVGHDCHDLTAMDVFKELPDEVESKNDVENHDLWQSFFNPDGSISKDFIDALKDLIQDNIDNSSLSDEEMSQVEKMKKDLQECVDYVPSSAGERIVGQKRPVDGLGKETINWNKILYNFVDYNKPEADWIHPNKNMISASPKIILPSVKKQERQKIFAAIDTSGSIDMNALRLFLSVLKNTPKIYQIDCVTFDTSVYPYNIKTDKEPIGGGGTRFDVIEQYIQENYKNYPKMVVVLTDGEGSYVKPQKPNRWAWLLYGMCCTSFLQGMKYYRIEDILK